MLNAKFPLKGYLLKSSQKNKNKSFSMYNLRWKVAPLFIFGMTCGAVTFLFNCLSSCCIGLLRGRMQFQLMFWVDRMGLFIGIFILLILSSIGSWRVYILSLLYCILLILIRMGLIKSSGSLQRMNLSKLKSYYRALMTGGSHAFPWKSIWR